MDRSTVYQRMTNNMKTVYDIALNEEELKKEFIHCNTMHKLAQEAKVNLPCVTEDGTSVIHASNLLMTNLSYYYERKRDLVKEFLPRDWVESQGVSSITFVR